MKKICKLLFIIFFIQAILPRIVMADANSDIQYLATVLYLNAREGADNEKQEIANQILDRVSYLQNQNGAPVSIQDVSSSLGYFSSFSDVQWAAITSENTPENQAWQECLSIAQSTVSSHYANASSEINGSSTPEIPNWGRGGNSTQIIENRTTGQAGTASPSGGGSSSSSSGSNTSSGSASGGSCPGAPTVPRSSVSSEYQDPGMFSKDILINMKKMMEMVYKSLGQIFMLAHGLICFATDIAYVQIGSGDHYIRLPNFSFLLCGFIIYLVIFFLSMTVGMYFVDVSFKLGFAVLFLPISLALWPFSPTKDKLASNFSIVIRNAMLFAFVAVGISYSVLLIKQGVIGNQNDWKEFWEVVDGGRSAYKDNMSHLSAKYSLDSTRILVIAFCLIFGFKIVSSSINDYLDKIFSDSGFGNSSPMHHAGTQAIGYIKSRTVDPVVSYAKDVALTQTGKAVSSVGQSMGRMAQGDFSDIKNIGKGIKNVGSAIRHPGRTFNKLSSKVGEKTNQAVQALGNAAVEIYDTANIFRHDQQTREEKTAKFRERVNNVTEKVGGTLQYGISNANVLRHPARTLAHATIATGAIVQAATQATANITKKLNHLKNTVIIRDEYERAVANEIQDNKIDSIADEANKDIKEATTTLGAGIAEVGDNVAKYTKEKANEIKDIAIEKTKQGVTIAAAAALNAGGANVTSEQVREGIHELKNKTKETINQANEVIQTVGTLAKGVGKQIGEKAKPVVSVVDNYTRPTSTTLRPSKILNPLIHPSQTVRTIKLLAKRGVREVKRTKGTKEKTKLIIKKGGQVVLRSARATVQETAQATLGLAGKFIDGIGKAMQNNRKSPNQKTSKQAAEDEEALRRDEEIRNQTLVD